MVIHKLDSTKTGRGKPSAVDPSTNTMVSRNETTQYYPASMVNVVRRYNPKGIKKISDLYDRLKGTQASFSIKPKSTNPVGRPKTVNPKGQPMTLGEIDLSEMFGKDSII